MEIMKKRIILAIVVFLILFATYWSINPRGIIGLVANSSDYKVRAHLIHRGWAKWNGRYEVNVFSDNIQTHSLTIKCSTPRFPVMHSLGTNSLYVDEETSTLVIDLPGEKKVTIAIK